jgi:hypothetical protein
LRSSFESVFLSAHTQAPDLCSQGDSVGDDDETKRDVIEIVCKAAPGMTLLEDMFPCTICKIISVIPNMKQQTNQNSMWQFVIIKLQTQTDTTWRCLQSIFSRGAQNCSDFHGRKTVFSFLKASKKEKIEVGRQRQACKNAFIHTASLQRLTHKLQQIPALSILNCLHGKNGEVWIS